MNKSKRVLMVTSVFPRYEGDATPPFVLNQAKELARAGWSVFALAPHGAGARWRETIEGVRVIRFPYFWPLRFQKLCYEGGMLINFRTRPWTKLLLPFFAVAEFAAVAWAIWRLKPDLLHTHSLLPQGWIGGFAASLFHLPHVTTAHGNDVFGLRKTGLSGAMKRWTLSRADRITVNSSATREAVLELRAAPEKVALVPATPNPVERVPDAAFQDQIKERFVRGRRPVLLFVGRMISEKGVADLLHALAVLERTHADLVALMIGDGQESSGFKTLAADLNLEERVHWAGWVPPEKVRDWMSVSDLLIVPSREVASGWKEAQGLVIVEAMLSRLPVVASGVGGIADMISDGRTGWLSPPGEPIMLAKRIDEALTSHESRANVIEQAYRAASDRFSASTVCRLAEDVYLQAMEARR